MARWQVQEAKARLSELLEKAQSEGPQVITKHGVDHVVVLDVDEYERLVGEKTSLIAWLLSGPTFDDLDVERSQDLGREVDLSA